MAVKIAAALGADVTRAQPGTDARRPTAAALGAADYRATADGSVFKDLRGQFDLIINTVSADLDVDAYLGLLRPFGAFVNVGLPPERRSRSASARSPAAQGRWPGPTSAASRATQEMLDFCARARHRRRRSRRSRADEVDDAYDRVVGCDVRYRFVIDTSTIQAG